MESSVSRLSVVRNVQALRALAACLVVGKHLSLNEKSAFPDQSAVFGWLEHYGHAGVDLFFVISGFIMLTTSWHAFGTPGASQRFFVRRLVRIYPPYWFALIPLLALTSLEGGPIMKKLLAETDLTASFLLLPQAHSPLLGSSWSLVFEMFFYAIFAALLMIRRRFIIPMLAIWFASEIVLAVTFRSSTNVYVAFLARPLPLEFIAGAFVGWLYVSGKTPFAVGALSVGVALSVVAWIVSLQHDLAMTDVGRVAAFGIPAAFIVYGAVGLERLERTVPTALVHVGDASYAIYLWHLPLMMGISGIMRHLHLDGPLAHVANLVVIVVAIAAVSSAVYRFFERPVTAGLNDSIRRPRGLRPMAQSTS